MRAVPTVPCAGTPSRGISSGVVSDPAPTQGFYAVNWSITSTTRYPADCNCPNPGGLVDPGLRQGSEVIPLIAPGSRLTPRLNQLDIGVRRLFHPRENMTLSAQAEVFNVLNANTVLTESETLGTSV